MPRPLREYIIPSGGEYGARRADGRTHHGTDYHPLDNNDGEPIYGTGPGGVVTHIGYNGDVNLGLGHNVTITYPGGRVTIDGHMRERTPLHVGSRVDASTVIGHVGHTGNAVNASPPGSHVHHQLTINGKLVDPEDHYGPTTAGSGTPITEQDDDMSRLVHHPDLSIALAGNDGTFIPLRTTDEVASLRATGAVGDKSTDVHLTDDFIWRLRTGIAARKAAQGSSDPAKVAAAIAPLLVPAVIAGLPKSAGLTEAQVTAAAEAAIRAVFADAAK